MLFICAALTFKGEPGFRLVSTESLNGNHFPTMDAPSIEVKRLIREGRIKGYKDGLEKAPFIKESSGSIENKKVYTVVTGNNLSEWYLVDSQGVIVESWIEPKQKESDIWNGKRVYYLDNSFVIQQGYLADGAEYKEFVSDMRSKMNKACEKDIERVQRKINMVSNKEITIDDSGVLKLSKGSKLEKLVIPDGVTEAKELYGIKEVIGNSSTLKSISLPIDVESVDLRKCENLKEMHVNRPLNFAKASLPQSLSVVRADDRVRAVFVGSEECSFKDWENLSVHDVLLAGEFDNIEIGNSKYLETAGQIFKFVVANSVKIGGNIKALEPSGTVKCNEIYLGDGIKSVRKYALTMCAKGDKLDFLGGASITSIPNEGFRFSKPFDFDDWRECYRLDLHLEQKTKLRKVEQKSFFFLNNVIIENLLMGPNLKRFLINSDLVTYEGTINLSHNLDKDSVYWWLRERLSWYNIDTLRFTVDQLKLIGCFIKASKLYSSNEITYDEYRDYSEDIDPNEALKLYVEFLKDRNAAIGKIVVYNQNTGKDLVGRKIR